VGFLVAKSVIHLHHCYPRAFGGTITWRPALKLAEIITLFG